MSDGQIERIPEEEIMDIQDEVDAYADADFSEVNASFVERLIGLAGSMERVTALDLGTGPADIPLRVLKERPAWRILAADASFPMLKRAVMAKSNLRKEPDAPPLQIWPLQTEAKSLPVAAKSIDVIFSNSILHHLTDVGLFWAEIKRIAKPQATLLLRDLARPLNERTTAKIVEEYAKTESPLLQQEFYRSLLAAYTPDEVRKQLDEAGLGSLTVAMASDRHLDVFGRIA